MYWMSMMHKNPTKTTFIVASTKFFVKPLAKAMSLFLLAF